MSSEGWNSLPLLPLKCVLDHLRLEDALAATSTCRNWREALFLYEARRDTLKLRVCDTQRSLFLVQLFRRYIQSLHIYIDETMDQRQMNQYLQDIVPKFLQTAFLHELIFVGPTYTDTLRHNKSDFKLNRALVENLIHVHRHTLQHLALFGCVVAPEDECYAREKERFGTRNRTVIKPAQIMLDKHNMTVHGLTSLKHILLEYEMLNEDVLENLAGLPNLTDLSLQLRNKPIPCQTLNWGTVMDSPNPLQVSINIIEVPLQKFEDIIQNVLVDELPLVALRVLFCKTVYEPLIKHITQLYHACLKEVEWTDAPSACAPTPVRALEYDDPSINPFILICWRCSQLQKLIIHGYWIWEYDLLGMVRLRANSLQWLEVSATYSREKRFCGLDCDFSPVRHTDRASPPDSSFVKEMNRILTFTWRPLRRWNKLHPALIAHSTAEDRSHYVLQQMAPLLGVT